MRASAVVVLCALSGAAAFKPPSGRVVTQLARKDVARSSASSHEDAAGESSSFDLPPKPTGLEALRRNAAWNKYVLIRPEGAQDDGARTGWAARTPGTTRTIIFSSVFCAVAAIPYALANPAVLVRLIEISTLSRMGYTPAEFFEATGKLF